MVERLRQTESNGQDHDTDPEDLLSEVAAIVRSLDARFGHAPDPATGYEGCGLCKTVSELKYESDYRARRDSERDERRKIWRERAQAVSALIGGLAVLCAGGWSLIKLIYMVVSK